MATFGKTTVGGLLSFASEGFKQVFKQTLSEWADVSKLSVNLISNATGQVLKAVIYADASGAPGVLLATSSAVTVTNTSAAWIDFPFASDVELAPGTYYLGFIAGATDGVARFAYDHAGTTVHYMNPDSYVDGPSDPFGAPTVTGTGEASAYATYEPVDVPTRIERGFIEHADAISGVAALGYEPKSLPKLPAVTMLFTRASQEDRSTGASTDVIWEWRVNLYVTLRDYREAQASVKALIPELLSITRSDPRLSDRCDWAVVSDEGSEPVFSHEEGFLLKSLRLRAYSTET